MAFLHPFYNRAFWRKQLRVFILQRDPICRTCNRNASTIADHIIPFGDDWVKFSDPSNIAGRCKPCHDKKTATFDGGFGNAPKTYDPLAAVITGEHGRQFQASTVGAEALDRALGTPEELKKLVEDIPQ